MKNKFEDFIVFFINYIHLQSLNWSLKFKLH